MSSVEQAYQTQIRNIQAKTGKSLEELARLLDQSGLTKHAELRSYLMAQLGLGYGDANALVHFLRSSDGERAAKASGASQDQVLDEIYAGPKAGLRPIHDRLMEQINAFGNFEVAPKKGYVSLRRKKQFAMIGPATNTRLEVGLNIKNLPDSERLVIISPGGMCNFKVKLSSPAEVNAELVEWLRQAFDASA